MLAIFKSTNSWGLIEVQIPLKKSFYLVKKNFIILLQIFELLKNKNS